MPLRQRRVRIIFAPYSALALILGLGYILSGPERTSAPSFVFAKTIAPMWVWGVVFIVGAVTMAAALLGNSARLLARALQIGGGIYVWWALCLLIAARTEANASLNAWASYCFIAAMHFIAAWLLSTRIIT